MKLTNRQMFCLMTSFLLGNILSRAGSMGSGEKTGYLAVFLSYAVFLVFVLCFHIIFRENGSHKLWEIIGYHVPKGVQKAVLCYVGICAFLSAFFSMANYVEFIQVSTYRSTPLIPCIVIVLLLVGYLCFCREKAMGRYCEIILPIVLIAVGILFVMGFRNLDVGNLNTGFSKKTIAMQGGSIFVAPFSQVVFVYLLSDSMQSPSSISKIAVRAGALVTVVFSLLYGFNLLILGERLLAELPYPTFYAATAVKVGTLIEHAETLVTFSYSFCDILYSAVCLLIGSRALELVVSGKNTKKITAYSAIIVIFILLTFLGQKIHWQTFYPIVTLLLSPLTLGLPAILVLVTLQKKNRQNKSSFSEKL